MVLDFHQVFLFISPISLCLSFPDSLERWKKNSELYASIMMSWETNKCLGNDKIVILYSFIYILAEKMNDSYQSNRLHAIEMTTKGSLPMEGVDMEPEPSNPYSPPRQVSMKQNGHKYRSPKSYSSQSLSHSSSTAASPGMLRPWQSRDTLGHRKSYGPKKLCIMETESHNTHYMPPQPYFVTNSKTEVTVWGTVIIRLKMSRHLKEMLIVDSE